MNYMRKFTKAIIVAFCVVIALFASVGCSDKGAPEHAVDNPQYVPDIAMYADAELEMFMRGHADRTSYTDGEKVAAEYLRDRIEFFGDGVFRVEIQDFVTSESGVSGLSSRNVIAKYLAADRNEQTKNIIIGAYYDNRHVAAFNGAKVYGGDGALAGGTGTAATLAIAKYFATQKPRLDYDVTFVFFGASYVTDAGAKAYLDNLNATESNNIALMVELQRLGVDHVYAFSDARATRREKFFGDIAAANRLDIYKITPKSPIIFGTSVLEGIPYFQWAHSGLFGAFFNAKIPTLNLIGANWETAVLADIESSAHANIAYTENDTLENLKKAYPDYAQKIAAAATLVIKALENNEILNVLEYDKINFPQTSVLSVSWLWYLIVFGISAIALAAAVAVSAHLGKKYQAHTAQPRNVKMAVFGMDYEDGSSGDIFVDIRNVDAAEDIFPEVSNNAVHGNIDDIFSPHTAMPHIIIASDDNSNSRCDEQSRVADEPEHNEHNKSAVAGASSSDNLDPFGFPMEKAEKTEKSKRRKTMSTDGDYSKKKRVHNKKSVDKDDDSNNETSA